jgi:hypothetical protein
VRDDHIGGTFSKMSVIELPTVAPHVRKRRRGNPNWKKGQPPAGPGRAKGSPNKYTREIKQAILDAVEYVGEEKAGEYLASLKRKISKDDPLAAQKQKMIDDANANLPRGISAYLVWISRDYPQVACAMLARMMPQQITAEHKVEHTYHSLEEIGNRLRELGLPAQRIYPLLEAKADDAG